MAVAVQPLIYRREGRLIGDFAQPGKKGQNERLIRVFSAHKDAHAFGALRVFNDKWGHGLGTDMMSLDRVRGIFREGLVVAVDAADELTVLGAMLVIRRKATVPGARELAVPLEELTGKQGDGYYATHVQDGNAFVCHRVASNGGVAEYIGKFVLAMSKELYAGEDRWVGPYSRATSFAETREYMRAHEGEGLGIGEYLRMGIDPVVHGLHEKKLGGKVLFVVEGGRQGDEVTAEYAPVMQFWPPLDAHNYGLILAPSNANGKN